MDEKDKTPPADETIMVGYFLNTTGDQTFDESLPAALRVLLGQSPYLHLISENEIVATLKLINPNSAKLTSDIVRQVCQLVRSKAYISGSIVLVGTHYWIGLDAVSCETSQSLTSVSAEATSKDEVSGKLGHASFQLRTKLGESLSSLKQFDVPITFTTSSNEALQQFSRGLTAFLQTGEEASEPYFEQAIQLDPKFAMAYAGLARAYINEEKPTKAMVYATKAYNLRTRSTKRERYRITATFSALLAN